MSLLAAFTNPWEKSIPITWLNFLASSNVDRPTAQPISRAMLGTSSCGKFKRQKSLLPQAYHSTHVRGSGFWNLWLFACRIRKLSRKFLLGESRIWNLEFSLRNPESHWRVVSGIQYQESAIHGVDPESKGTFLWDDPD